MNNQNNTLHANLVYNLKSNIGIGTPLKYDPASKLIINVNERIMKYNELESLVIAWATQKGILEKGTPTAQCDKTLEEVYELHEAIKNNDRDEIIDALGDILVTIIIQAEMQGLKLEDCLQSAYNVISKRKGQMIDGQFVKEK
jgi:NTP pyrophosphatase (non-canonical NTP hydrolase)